MRMPKLPLLLGPHFKQVGKTFSKVNWWALVEQQPLERAMLAIQVRSAPRCHLGFVCGRKMLVINQKKRSDFLFHTWGTSLPGRDQQNLRQDPKKRLIQMY